jgi:hypothetical protein
MDRNDEFIDHYYIDPVFWDELERINSGDVRRRAMVESPPDGNGFLLPWGKKIYRIDLDRREVIPADPQTPPAGIELAIVSLLYLLKCRELPETGKWISEKDLPGGETFFRGPHAFPFNHIEEKFKDDTGAFLARGKDLGGSPAQMGDASIALSTVPRIPLMFILWTADEEFPAQVKLLMDSSIQFHLPLDGIYGLVCEVSSWW